MLPKKPFFSFDTYLSGCLHTLCWAVGLPGIPHNPALSLALSSDQPDSPSLAFQFFVPREQRRPWHSRDCDQWVGFSARKEFSGGLLTPESCEQKRAGLAACQDLNREVTSAYPSPRGVGDHR